MVGKCEDALSRKIFELFTRKLRSTETVHAVQFRPTSALSSFLYCRDLALVRNICSNEQMTIATSYY